MKNGRPLPRCRGCGRFPGPRDVVCGFCGTADCAAIEERAALLGFHGGYGCLKHYCVESGTGLVCVICGNRGRPGAEPHKLVAGSRRICLCCGSRIARGSGFCSTCGAAVSRGLWPAVRGSRPRREDQPRFIMIGEHAGYVEQRDPHYRFDIGCPAWQRWTMIALFFLSIMALILVPVYAVNQRVPITSPGRRAYTRASSRRSASRGGSSW